MNKYLEKIANNAKWHANNQKKIKDLQKELPSYKRGKIIGGVVGGALAGGATVAAMRAHNKRVAKEQD